MINRFELNHAFLNNFFRHHVIYEGSIYPSVGHAFAASKTPDQRVRMRIANMATAREVIDWERKQPDTDRTYQEETMQNLLIQKFQTPSLLIKLRETGTQELVYGNSPDDYWGIDERTGKGHNHLGKILMDVRELL